MEDGTVSFSLYSLNQYSDTIEKGRIVLITGLDKNCNKSTIKMFFSREQRSGGGPMEKIVHIEGPDGNAVLIYFKDSNG